MQVGGADDKAHAVQAERIFFQCFLSGFYNFLLLGGAEVIVGAKVYELFPVNLYLRAWMSLNSLFHLEHSPIAHGLEFLFYLGFKFV